MAHNTWHADFSDHSFPGADGAPLRAFVRRGDVNKVPVVLLHGLSQTRHFWGPVVRQLPSDWPLAVLDQRGHGDSDVVIEAPVPFALLAADVVNLLDSLGWSRAHIVGHSWGGGVAGATAGFHPDRTAVVTCVDGGLIALQDLGDRDDVRKRLTPPNRPWDVTKLPDLFARSPLGPWLTPETTDALLAAFRVDASGQARSRLGFDRHMHVLDGMLDEHPEDYLARIEVPAWVVIAEPLPGSGDPYDGDSWAASREAAVERAIALLAQPRVVRITGALHDVPLQYPNLIAGVIASAHEEHVAEPVAMEENE